MRKVHDTNLVVIIMMVGAVYDKCVIYKFIDVDFCSGNT